MKKFILFSIFLLTAVFFLSSKVDAQTRQECEKTRARASYNCLTLHTKCIWACPDKTKNDVPAHTACLKDCEAEDSRCMDGVNADNQACLAAIKKDKKEVSSETVSGQDCWKIFDKESYKCLIDSGDCSKACLKETEKPDGSSYFNSGEIYKECMKSSDCEGKSRACDQQTLTNYRACIDGNKKNSTDFKAKPSTGEETEKPQGVVSSKDLRNILRAINEEQHAQAELEKVKEAHDPRYEAKKDFASEYKAALEEEFIPIEQEDKLKILRGDLEQIKKYAETYSNVKDFTEYLREGKFGPSSKVGTASTVGDGVITYLELLEKGVSQEDAISKSVIDTVAIGSFNALPPLKAAELAATLPDDIMSGLRVSKDHWSRKPTVYLKDNSPSAFVKLTTDTMIQTKNWTNVGGALEVAWEDFKSAEGVGGKAKAALDLAGTAAGTVPVAIAMRTRDQITGVLEAVKLGASGAGQVISGWFTWPD